MSVGAVNKQTGERIPTAGMPAVDSVLSGTSTNPVQNKVVKAALDAKQDTLTFDDTPTDGSNNPVKSNGIYDALATKANTDMVAADFNAGTSYTAGNYCIYEGKLYKFKNNHSGAWSAADVDEVKITGELSSLKSGLISIHNIDNNTEITATTSLDYTGMSYTTPVAGYYCIEVMAEFSNSAPDMVGVSSASDVFREIVSASRGEYSATCHITRYLKANTTLYVFAKYSSIASNRIFVRGFYLT